MITAVLAAIAWLVASPPTTDSCPVPVPVPTETIPGNGTWLVGADITPGTYRTDNTGDGLCAWYRLSGLSGTNDDWIDFGTAEGPSFFEVLDTDVAVQLAGSGNCVWTRVEI